jgi:hypothetical protein
MNADEIMHVLRLTAMGRLNTPAQEEFCEKLAKAMAEPESAAPTADAAWDGQPLGEVTVQPVATTAKRTRKTPHIRTSTEAEAE